MNIVELSISIFSCVTIIIIVVFFNLLISETKNFFEFSSKYVKGSSNIITGFLDRNVLIKEIFCFSPPDISSLNKLKIVFSLSGNRFIY